MVRCAGHGPRETEGLRGSRPSERSPLLSASIDNAVCCRARSVKNNIVSRGRCRTSSPLPHALSRGMPESRILCRPWVIGVFFCKCLSLIVTRGPEIDRSPPPKLAPLAPTRLTNYPPTGLQNLSCFSGVAHPLPIYRHPPPHRVSPRSAVRAKTIASRAPS